MINPVIEQLLMIPSGSYHDMPVRPYTLLANERTLSDLERVTEGFRNISAGGLAGIAGDMLRPSFNYSGLHFIPNGWDSQRFSFMMRVTYPNRDQDYPDDLSVRVHYIQGFTDRISLIRNQRTGEDDIDPDTQFFIGTVYRTREIRRRQYQSVNMQSVNRFLRQNGGLGNRSQTTAFAMRPRDVLQATGNFTLGEYVDADYRSSLSAQSVFSTVGNELPADYMSRTLQSFRLANNTANQGDDLAQVISTAASSAGDDPYIDDPLITMLENFTELSEGMYFSYRELCRLFDNTEENTSIIDVPPVQRDIGFAMHNPRDSEVWTTSDITGEAAHIVSNEIPAIMSQCMLTQVSFTITNDAFGHQPVFRWHSAPKSFMAGDIDLSTWAAMFEDMVTKLVFTSISRRNEMVATLNFFSDIIMADSRFELQIDGGPLTPFAVPNFATSIANPVVANNRKPLDDMAGAVRSVISHMSPSYLGTPTLEDLAPTGFEIGGQSIGQALLERDERQRSAGTSRFTSPSTGSTGGSRFSR